MKLILTIGLLLLLTGCTSNEEVPQACTMIGCESGVRVEFAQAPPHPFTVQVTFPDGTSQSASCDRPGSCVDGVFFAGDTPDRVTVRVTTATGTATHSLEPVYRSTQPNGPDCPPTCRQGTVRVPAGES